MEAPIDREQVLVWTRQVIRWWHYYNREYLNEALDAPAVELVANLGSLGTWEPERRRICLRLEHVARDPWHESMATLRHEMAHQLVDEVLGSRDGRPHGESFAKACGILRVEARARSSGQDPVAAAADDEAAALTRRISKLLALGASPNEHEATAAVNLARSLMLQHNLDVVEADRKRDFHQRVLGPVARRHHSFAYRVSQILADFFFVEALWSEHYDPHQNLEGKALYVYGTQQNLEMASYVHDFLWGVLPRLWAAHQQKHRIRSNGGRLSYFDGVLSGFHGKLREAERARTQASTALVWRGDPKLEAYLRWHNPRIRTVSRGTVASSEAREAGKAAGRKLEIHRPLDGGAPRFGGLLGP